MIEQLPEHVKNLTEYVQANIQVDGMYKVTVLRTVAAYFEALTHAEGLNAVIRKNLE